MIRDKNIFPTVDDFVGVGGHFRGEGGKCWGGGRGHRFSKLEKNDNHFIGGGGKIYFFKGGGWKTPTKAIIQWNVHISMHMKWNATTHDEKKITIVKFAKKNLWKWNSRQKIYESEIRKKKFMEMKCAKEYLLLFTVFIIYSAVQWLTWSTDQI